ncbi:Sumo-Interacting Motif-Containing Protein 1 [Manis pentadactyla]|nr:Sumo-Interacting Motif-Containing Protein 1 [Manis pentadactyla]
MLCWFSGTRWDNYFAMNNSECNVFGMMAASTKAGLGDDGLKLWLEEIKRKEHLSTSAQNLILECEQEPVNYIHCPTPTGLKEDSKFLAYESAVR